MILLIPFIALFAPFMLWPIETVLPYPFIVEELFKGGIVYIILQVPKRSQLILIVLSGLFFALSEGVFYLFNIYSMGNLSLLGFRLVLTIPMHIITMLIIFLFSYKKQKLLVVGIGAAIILHFLFNTLIVSLRHLP